MQMLSLVWGILAIVGMLIGFIPCFGAFNWLNIPFAGIGVIICAIALAMGKDHTKGSVIAGLICCIIALFFGIIRLVLGGGVV